MILPITKFHIVGIAFLAVCATMQLASGTPTISGATLDANPSTCDGTTLGVPTSAPTCFSTDAQGDGPGVVICLARGYRGYNSCPGPSVAVGI